MVFGPFSFVTPYGGAWHVNNCPLKATVSWSLFYENADGEIAMQTAATRLLSALVGVLPLALSRYPWGSAATYATQCITGTGHPL